MTVTRSNQYGEIDHERLRAFERRIGVRLPDEYRTFLIAHNGGRPEPCHVCLPGSAEPFDCMHHTFGLHDGPSYFSLEHKQKIYSGRIPSTVLAFADDPGGNLFCIGIGGGHLGKVYFWDHESEGLGTPTEETLCFVARSFGAFLECLRAGDDA